MVAKTREEKYSTADCSERIAKAREAHKELCAVVKENYNSGLRIHTASIRILEYYGIYLEKYINVMENAAKGDKDGAEAAMRDFKNTVGKIELCVEPYYDQGQAAGMLDNGIVKLI